MYANMLKKTLFVIGSGGTDKGFKTETNGLD